MRNLLATLTLIVGLGFAAPQAKAQFSIFPYVGYNLDFEGFLIGVGGEFVAPFEISNLDLTIAPSVEYVFADDGGIPDFSINVFQVNGDVIARFNPQGSFVPYAGAGLAIVRISVDGPDILDGFGGFGFDASSTDVGLNALGGALFPGLVGFGDLYAQGRVTFANGTAISIIGGFRIPLGQ
ncbi:MAG: hypothetical protein AAGG50_01650 [Bacteroidota bacterium]